MKKEGTLNVMENAENIESDTEEDCEGYFLEPSANHVNISDRIAEANKKLFEENLVVAEDEESRPRKVQFCENLVDFEPPQIDYYSEETETESEEETQNKTLLQTINETKESQDSNDSSESSQSFICHNKTVDKDLVEDTAVENIPDEADVVTAEDIEEMIKADTKTFFTDKANVEEDAKTLPEPVSNSKVLVVLIPREQASSFESVVGEDVQDDSDSERVEEEDGDLKEVAEVKPRPKSANKSTKAKQNQKRNCKMSTIAPELNCSVEAEKKSWHEPQGRLKPRGKIVNDMKKVKEVAKSNGVIQAELEKERPGTSRETEQKNRHLPQLRPKTAPTKRPCCPVKTNLPVYNGLRSEYGLSSEQLQERRRKIAESKQHRREEEQCKRHENSQKRQENEAKFTEWLESKSNRLRNGNASNIKSTKKDTLLRSDVYIQNNAVYATKCGVAYAVNYSLGKSRIQEIRRKTVNLGKLFDNLSPHAQKTYRIYLNAK